MLVARSSSSLRRAPLRPFAQPDALSMSAAQEHLSGPLGRCLMMLLRGALNGVWHALGGPQLTRSGI